MKGVELLNKHQVEWNALAVVNEFNANYPLDFYNFFKQINCHYIQFSPIVEQIYNNRDRKLLTPINKRGKYKLTKASITPKQWGNFLCAIFDEWVHNDVGIYYIQLFDATLANWIGVPPGVCTLGKTCGHSGVIEFNGDIYSCDHFVFPRYKLGNIYTKSLIEMLYSDQQMKFGQNKFNSLPKQCKECKYLFTCNGECPKNRFCLTATGETGLNYLCEGFYNYFKHVTPYMDYMKKELPNKRAPANIMKKLSNNNFRL